MGFAFCLSLPEKLRQPDVADVAQPAVVGRNRHVKAFGDPLVAAAALEVVGAEHPAGIGLGIVGGGCQLRHQLLQEEAKKVCPADRRRPEAGKIKQRTAREPVRRVEVLEGGLHLFDAGVPDRAGIPKRLPGEAFLVDCPALPR